MTATSTPPRIACVHLLDDFSGSAKVFACALTELAESGAALRVVIGSAGAPGFIRSAHAVETVFYRFHENKALLLLFFAIAQTLMFFRVLDLCLFWRADIVYANTVLNPGAMLAGRLCGRRVVVHVHEVGLGSRSLFFVLSRLMRWSASRIVCVSRYVRDSLELPERKAPIVYNSLPRAEWFAAQNLPVPRDVETGPFTVFMACSLKWYKGIDSFVALARRASARPPGSRSTKFTLALNCSVAEWLAFSRAWEIPPALEVVCRPADVYDHYRNAGLVVNLSHSEGWIETFGMTLLEAMISGVPVICPTVGGCLELVAEDEGGWHLDSRDLDRIDSVMVRLSTDANYLSQCRQSARDRALRFDPSGFATGIRTALLG